MSESLTTKQVAEHASVEKGLYIIIDSDVYKMDTFVDEHPGGAKILKRVGGKDASKQFWKVSWSGWDSRQWEWLLTGIDLVSQRERIEEVCAEA
jgi:cytochrome b involved in lipid metabolism